MQGNDILYELGLSKGEVRVYLALLKMGETTVGKLTKETKQHRATIYDLLEILLHRGLISYVVKSGVKYYRVADVDKLMEYVKEKEIKLGETLPELRKLQQKTRQEAHVEVYQGLEGLKTVFNDRIKVGGDMYAFGIDETMFKKEFATLVEQLFRREKERGLKEFILTKQSACIYVASYCQIWCSRLSLSSAPV